MTIVDMERFKHVALNIQPEATDVVYAGLTAKRAKAIATDESTKAASKIPPDTAGSELWTARATKLAKVERVAPGAAGIVWRAREERIYFVVPGLGFVQSVMVDQFIEEFAPTNDESTIYAMVDRGIEAVFEIVTAWGWNGQK